MAKSPLDNAVDRISFSILVDGAEIDGAIQVLGLTINKAINAIPFAQLIINDGDPAEGEFKASEYSKFKPGGEVKIKLGYESKEEIAFEGIIITQKIKVANYQHKSISQLIITCFDKAFKLTLARKNENFSKKKDSEIISAIVSAAGLSSGEIQATTFQHPNLIQFNTTDWDFILARAKANGLLVSSEAGKISVKKLETSGSEVLVLDYGSNIIDFKAELDARTQIKSAELNSWDSTTQKYFNGKGTAVSGTSQGNIMADDLAKISGNQAFVKNTSTSEDKTMLKAMADAELAYSRFSRIVGEVTSFGTNMGELGSFIKLEGFGALFNGLAFISSVYHELKAGIWKTTFGFGLDYKTYKSENPLNHLVTSTNLPAITGLHIGKVKKIEADPLGEFRVLLDLPIIEETGEGVWARMAHTYATKDAGFYFFPEVDDEVIVGFLDNDPRFAVIVGSLYSKKNTPPSTPEKKNSVKEIVSKNKLKISFDEEKKVIEIETPGGQKFTLSDDEKSIKLADKNKNTILMSDAGITLDSAKDITLKSKGKITVSATGALALSSKADVSLSGNNINNKAKMAFKGEGSASAEIKASGSVIVKGAIVKIN